MMEGLLGHGRGHKRLHYHGVSENNTSQKNDLCHLVWSLLQWKDILQRKKSRSKIIIDFWGQTVWLKRYGFFIKIELTVWQISFAQRASSFSLVKCFEINCRICDALSSWFIALSSTKNKQPFSKSFRSNVHRSFSNKKRWVGAPIIWRYSQIIANVRFGRVFSDLRTF